MSDLQGNGIFESIQIGKRYPISLGQGDARVLTLQYLFKPANVANPVSGQMNGVGNSSSNEVTVTLESADGAREMFKGVKRESTSADHECLLTFSRGAFKVQKVDELVLNLRVQREENIAKSKESSSKESKALLDSRKLPKFLQKAQPKKRSSLATAPKEEPADTTTTIINDNASEEIVTAETDPIPGQDTIKQEQPLETCK